MADARVEKTKSAVKEALLAILQKKSFDSIGMSEVAKAAGISRSTLYANYPNLQDAFDDLVIDFHRQLQPLGNQLRCSGCNKATQTVSRVPYCRAVRNAGKYAPLVCDASYLPSMLRATAEGKAGEMALRPYQDAGLSEQMARRMYSFQMSACYTAAMSVSSDEEWAAMQQTVDKFIAGGLDALRRSR